MKSIKKVIDELRVTNSKNEKLEILKRNKELMGLEEVLLFTYNPFFMYGLTEKVFKDLEPGEGGNIVEFFAFLNKLAATNINNNLRTEAIEMASRFTKEEMDLVIGVFCKDLKIGMTAKSINKVFKDLIPEFDVQLATPLEKIKLKEGEEIWITEKYDGIRCVCMVDKFTTKFFTRNGKEVNGLNDLKKDIDTFIEENCIPRNMVLDGELLKVNNENKNSGDLYRDTVSIVNSKLKEKKDIIFNIFDAVPIDEFLEGVSIEPYAERRFYLDSWADVAEGYCNYIKITPVLYQGTDHSVIANLLESVEKQGKEGLMININDVYKCKRVKSLIKVKSFFTEDLVVVSIVEGTGRNKGRLGALVVDYKENKVEVGSGFTDEEREEIWNGGYDSENSIIGKIIEVQYFEESKNKNGEISLRFPTFKGVRFDKE